MKVAVDFTAGVRQPAGVGRYTRSLVRALAHSPGPPLDLTLLWAGPARVPPPEDWPQTRTRRLPLPERWMIALWQRLRAPLPADLLAGGADVFYSPDFALPPLWRARPIVTVHDLSYLTHPETHYPPLRAYLEQAVPRAVRRAHLVLADSEQTKRDLQAYLGVPPNQVEVVLSAADPAFRPASAAAVAATLARHGVDRPYLLSVGTIQPRKNLPAAFTTLRRLVEAGEDLLLVHVGGRGWLYEPIFAALEVSGVTERVRFLSGVPDEALAALYTGAEALLFPSLYEGFGIPCLEAMACGTPVIAANTGSLPEVVGHAGMQVDPHDVDAMVAGVLRLRQDHEWRAALAERGSARAARFTWEASGRQLRGLLERVAQR